MSARKSLSWLGSVLVLALVASLGTSVSSAREATRLTGLRGEQLTDSDLAGGATVLVVWASWSPRCRDIVERVNPLAERWGGKARVGTVNFQEDRAAVEAFLRGKSLSAPVYLDADGAFSKRNAVTTLPGLLVYVDGQVAYSGRLPEDPDSLLSKTLR
jgi:thiol-disulfide isomerase/thioredoxin